MMRLIFIFIIMLSFGCSKSDDVQGNKRADVIIKFNLSTDKNNFMDTAKSFGHAVKAEIDGPEAMPGKDGDDYIFDLRDGKHIFFVAGTTGKEGMVTFYCQPIDKYPNNSAALSKWLDEFFIVYKGGLPNRISSVKFYLNDENKEIIVNGDYEKAASLLKSASCIK